MASARLSPARLSRESSPAGISFSIGHDSSNFPIDAWADQQPIVSSDGHPINLSLLIALRESEDTSADEDRLLVPWRVVAKWSPAQLRSLHLPEPYCHGIQLDRKGLVHDPDFSVSYRFIRLNGQQFTSAKRVGALVRIASKEYTLLSPLYEAVDAVERWGSDERSARDPLTAAGELLETLDEVGASIRKDGYLQTIRIATANGFTVRPYLNKAGVADFDPVLARHRRQHPLFVTDPDNTPLDSEAALPESKEEEFASQFRSFANVNSRYALGDGWLVVMPPNTQKALQIAKDCQCASPSARREFIRNPRATLRTVLGDELEEAELEDLFWESDEYAHRVRDIGVRIPKVVSFIVRPAQPWLPPEQAVLAIGPERLVLDRGRAAALSKRLREAIEDGRHSVEFEGQTIPAISESVEAIRQITTALNNSPARDAVGIDGEEDNAPSDQETFDAGIEESFEGPIALLVDDNLDEITYQVAPRSRGEVAYGSPSQLGALLFPHQDLGLRWLQDSWATGLPGVLLADDMGLGKTLQVLAFLAWIREIRSNDSRPMLIVAPTGLIRNWILEAETHLGNVGEDGPGRVRGLGHPVAATGSGLRGLRRPEAAKGRETDGGLPVLDVDRLRRESWVLTTYESLRDYQHSFGRIDWSVLVLDEAQKIKNPVALATDAVKAMNADFRIALTGTPVENHIADLWSIVDAIFPGRLGALRDFVSRHQGPDDLGALRQDLIEATPPALMLRRMKEDHLRGLPEIHRYADDGQHEMPPIQAKTYDEIVEAARKTSGKGFMMTCLQRLRLASVHPDPFSTEPDEDFIRASAKLSYLFKVLDKVRQDSQKALIFLDSLDMQGAIAGLIRRRYDLDRLPMILNGSVAGSKRTTMVETFQSEPDRFDALILSPKAGGVGLTLTEANHVIHLMRWWNPAVEDQATDRAYRIGQRRPVHVYLPSAIHPEHGEYSFDIRLHELLERKRKLSRQLFAPDVLNSDDIESLFNDSTRGSGDKRPR